MGRWLPLGKGRGTTEDTEEKEKEDERFSIIETRDVFVLGQISKDEGRAVYASGEFIYRE